MISFYRNFKSCFILILLLISLASNVEAAKGSNRHTATLSLDNGLDVFLISDPDVHRSCAALSVGIGHLYDPFEKQGLAHYLEHMLFLGTKKYPDVGSYKKYLDEYSGSSNAYTAGAVTNYFFEVSHEGFNGALDRFSDFFKSPLFDKTYSAREVEAVNNEHQKNKLSDGWRGMFIENRLSEPGHPLTKFGTGNLETLAGDNTEALQTIYKEFYAASNMKLAMLSNMPLELMVKAARDNFSEIPDHEVKHPEISADYRKPLNGNYRLLKVKTIKDVRSLSIDFPTIRLVDFKDSKPASIVGSVLGYEGKGSLLSKLKEEGLVSGLSAGGGSEHHNINSFGVSASLTPKGLKEYKKILNLVFAYINKIREYGIQEYTFKENQTMAQINFDWKSPDEGMHFIADKAEKMHDYELNEMETLPYLITRHDPAGYKALLDTLIPENALITLSHNAAKTDQTVPYYDAEYSFQKVGGKEFDDLKNPLKVADITYPEKNDFIPYHLDLIEEPPHLVHDDSLARIWFKFDNKFKQPKMYLSFLIETPLTYRNPENIEFANLYEAAVSEGLNEIVYPIQMAGLSYSLGVGEKGVTLTIGGYSERIDDLLMLVIKNLKDIKIDNQKFNNIKESMIRGLENQKLDKAYARGGYYNRLIWLDKFFTEEEKLEALKIITLADLKTYTGKLFKKVFITGVAHGNWTDEKVKESVNLLLKELNSKPLPEKERFEQIVEVLKPGERYKFSREVEDNNSSMAYAIQVGEKSFDLQARTAIVSSVIENDFYTQMRTNQQLGYIVWSFHHLIEKRLFFRLVIQSSTHDPFDISNRVNEWLLNSGKLFTGLTDEEFERHRQGLIVSLEKEADSIGSALVELYALATEEEGDFQHKEKLIAAVKNLTKEDIVKTAREIFMNPETPRIEVLMRAKGSKVAIPDGVISEVSEFKNRKK